MAGCVWTDASPVYLISLQAISTFDVATLRKFVELGDFNA